MADYWTQDCEEALSRTVSDPLQVRFEGRTDQAVERKNLSENENQNHADEQLGLLRVCPADHALFSLAHSRDGRASKGTTEEERAICNRDTMLLVQLDQSRLCF
jgi:hypothetical protein